MVNLIARAMAMVGYFPMVRMNRIARGALLAGLLATTAGCGSGLVGQAGPSARAVMAAPEKSDLKGIDVVDLSSQAVARLGARDQQTSFASALGEAQPVGTVVRQGDVLEVSIWEAPPAVLFGGAAGSSKLADMQGTSVSTTSTLPELLVGLSGSIFVPFAGNVPVAGRSTKAIESDITARLSGKAHLPQVIVRIVRNATANVTVVGEVANSSRMPLTPKGERVLDALAHAGGTRQQSGKMTIQVTRGQQVVSMPLDAVIRDPRQNVMLATGDVVTAIYQPYSFTVLGAAGKNEEVNFESTGLTLAQALGRIGGLQDQRANAKGLFIFRWEDPALASGKVAGPVAADGRVPVIYRANLRDPATFFLAQNFAMRNGDVVYVANAPIAEFQQFVNVIASTVLPLVAVKNSIP